MSRHHRTHGRGPRDGNGNDTAKSKAGAKNGGEGQGNNNGGQSSPLLRLAERAGLATQWEDAHGKPQRVADDTLRTILGKLGLPGATDEEIQRSNAALDAEQTGHLPPLLTAEAGRALTLPGQAYPPGTPYRIEFEDGGGIEGKLVPGAGRETAALAAIDQTGYHRLRIGEHESRLAVAPPRCFQVADALPPRGAPGQPGAAPRTWAVGAQLYGLRRTGDGGLGDYTALADCARGAAGQGAHAVALSPVHAMFSAQPEKISPYSPSSRLFLNVLHIDPARAFGAEALADAIATLGLADELAQLDGLDLIDWPRAGRARLAILRHFFERFVMGDLRGATTTPEAEAFHATREAFEAFRARGGDALADHARFEAIHAHLLAESSDYAHWTKWPEPLRSPTSPAVAQFAAEHAHEVDFHLFLQWLADAGLAHAQHEARANGMALGLITDLAVGCDSGGSHAWSYRDDMLQGVSVGAPPDLFNQAGQSWGLTTFSPRAMTNQGFSAFIDMLRAAFAHAGGIRIDHILGLQRLWLVPDGAPAKDGVYLSYPIEDLLRLIALESWRHRAIVIGEDLGTVPPGFRERLAAAGLLGIRVLWFEREGDAFIAPDKWGDNAIATTTTHDLPTVSGWWRGSDIEWRTRIGQAAPAEAGTTPADARAADRAELWQAFGKASVASASVPPPGIDEPPVDEALAYVGRTPAPLVAYPLEDLLGLADQPNLPGSIDEHPNWRRRMTLNTDEIFADPTVADRLKAIGSLRQRT